LAVAGILIFQKPFYDLLYFENKLFDKIWRWMSVSVAAQLLTFPLCIYYFHQFPLLFLTANLIAVPLMAIILYAEVLLIFISPFHGVALYWGKIISVLIGFMNKAILLTSHLPFAVWRYIFATVLSTVLLYAIIVSVSTWLMNKNKLAFKFSLTLMAFFILLMGSGKWSASNQQKLIVYNTPQHKAIDVVSGYDYKFIGDPIFSEQSYFESFYLRPGRTSLRLDNSVDTFPSLIEKQNFLQINNKRVLLIDSAIVFQPMAHKIDLDMIIISKNPKLFIPQLDSVFNCRQYIFDASNTLWKIDNWKKDCERLHLPFHSVPEKGAFITDL